MDEINLDIKDFMKTKFPFLFVENGKSNRCSFSENDSFEDSITWRHIIKSEQSNVCKETRRVRIKDVKQWLSYKKEKTKLSEEDFLSLKVLSLKITPRVNNRFSVKGLCDINNKIWKFSFTGIVFENLKLKAGFIDFEKQETIYNLKNEPCSSRLRRMFFCKLWDDVSNERDVSYALHKCSFESFDLNRKSFQRKYFLNAISETAEFQKYISEKEQEFSS